MIYLKTEEEIELLRKANGVVAGALAEVARMVKPGITTRQLDNVADQYIRDHRAIPVFKGFPNPYGGPFPASICASVNDCIVHGVPDDRPLEDGDIVSVDCGAYIDGYNGDSCYTFCVGEVRPEIRELLRVTKEALYEGISQVRVGSRIGDIGFAVQQRAEQGGYGVVREFVGHGVGRKMHEDPMVPNYGKKGNGKVMKNGLCIAIEPMITQHSPNLYLADDKWSAKTQDGGWAAHFEHSVALHKGKVDILSSFEEIEAIENQNK